MRRERGGGQSQLQGGQEDLLSPKLTPFLNLQNRAGPHTARAETTANITRQHLTQLPDLLDISLINTHTHKHARTQSLFSPFVFVL